MGDIVAAPDEEADDGNGVGDVEEGNAGCYHAEGHVNTCRGKRVMRFFTRRGIFEILPVESSRRPEVKQTEKSNDEAAHGVRLDRNVQLRMHVTQKLSERQTPVPGETPAEPRLPGVGSDQAAYAGSDDQALEDDRTAPVRQGLVEELEDGDERGRVEEAVEILHAEEHGDGVEPGRDETDGHRAHDGDGYHLFRAGDLLCHVGCAIQASECPVCVDQADNEGDPVGRPAGIVDEVCEHELGFLVGWGLCRNGHEDDEEGEQGGVQCDGRDRGQDLSVAVEEEAEGVDELVGNDDVPRLDCPTIHL